jgi:hypothetical protein
MSDVRRGAGIRFYPLHNAGPPSAEARWAFFHSNFQNPKCPLWVKSRYSGRNQRREAEINDALKQEHARREAAVKNMYRLRALRLEREAKLNNE